MAKLPYTKQTEVVILRISPKLKKKLNELAHKKNDTASGFIRDLIESEFSISISIFSPSSISFKFGLKRDTFLNKLKLFFLGSTAIGIFNLFFRSYGMEIYL